MKIAVSMIVKNEEEMLARCLESVKDFDAIYLTDTGSEDKTVEIAQKYTDNISYFEWCDSFCKARNFAKEQIPQEYEWIMTIDADEYLENTYKQVKTVLKQAKADVVNVNLKAENTGVIHTFPRLYKNKPDTLWVNDVHNLLNKTSREYSDITIVYGYSPAHKKDPDRAMRILMKSLVDNPDKVREKYYLAREYYYRHWWQKAIDMFDKYIEESKFLSEKNDAWLLRARCLAGLKKWNEAVDSALQAVKYNANFKEALYFIGDHMDSGNKPVWHKFAEIADNSNVLFKRERPISKGEKDNPKVVYYCDGMKFFGEKMIKCMGFKRYDKAVDINKKVFFEGLYFDEDYKVLKEHKGEKVIYWNGSDVLMLKNRPDWQKILKETDATHLCQSKFHLPILEEIGLKGEHFPIFFGDLGEYNICFKPSKKPHVYMNCHPGREKEYGVDIAKKVAPKVPDVTFHIYGSDGEDLPNFKYHGRVDEGVMDEEIREFQGCIKGGSDGISQVLTKSIYMGQYPISYKKIDGVWHAPTQKELILQLNRLKEQTKPNIKLRKKYEKYYKAYEH